METIQLLGQLLWLFLPAGIANMMPVFVRSMYKELDVPVDLGLTIANKPLFGPHKTWRGLIFAVLGGLMTFLLQLFVADLYGLHDWWHISPYSLPLYFGAIIGAGAIFGDLFKSLFKRRVNIGSGKSWIPFDQIDYVLGSALAAAFYIDFTAEMWILIVLIGPLLHIVVNHIAYATRIRKEKW